MATAAQLVLKTVVVAVALAKRATAQPGSNSLPVQSATTPRKAH
jgi:hypothetical protein